MIRRSRLVLTTVVIAALVVSGVTFAFTRDDASEGDGALGLDPATRTFASDGPIERACDLSDEMLIRLWRGHHPVHSEDVTIVPQAPNYSGSFKVTSHSGPWDYVQRVPLVFYGPRRINSTGLLPTEASVADIYPTVGDLAGVDLERRDGRSLDRALRKGVDGTPRLVALVVWDGVGRNVLDLWPDRWPNLKRLEEQGTSFWDATVGSSPSITPATHATMGTGAFPRDHAVTAIEYRTEEGPVRGVYRERDPSDLRLSTYIDEIDRALGNEPKAGMIAWKSWHLGMLGHGTQTPGGDADHFALIGAHGGDVSGNPTYYSTPAYLREVATFEEYARALDRADGNEDGLWRGHEIEAMHDNPAWVHYEADLTLELWRREGYGADTVPDFFVTNYKMTDIVSHQYSIDSEEMGDVLQAQDFVLGRMIEYLDRNVGDYVMIVTSDHGNTPRAARSGAWPLLQGQLREDIDAHFDTPQGRSLIAQTTAAGPFLNYEVADELEVTADDVARFLNDYTIRDNWGGKELPEGYEDRGDEHVLSAAFASDRIDEVMACRFGSPRPPRDARA